MGERFLEKRQNRRSEALKGDNVQPSTLFGGLRVQH
jgi:hypothetical protein